jgi:hypothetical protein
MFEKLFEENDLSKPPLQLGDEFLDWVTEAQTKLDVLIIDRTPLTQMEIDRIRRQVSMLPNDLAWFYAHVTPWSRMENGIKSWNEHIEMAYRYFEKAALRRGTHEAELEQRIASAPVLLPVNLSHKATAVAFTDAQQRLAIIDGNIGPTLGRPMAIGLRSYLIQQVLVEIVWCDKGYRTYAQAMGDPWVSEAGGWPEEDPPRHLLTDAYQQGYWQES